MAAGGDYVCPLSEASIKKAKEELNEDPKDRLNAVEAFRKWVLEQPHITCPTDTRYLLQFLRARKFSQLEARRMLESNLTLRHKLGYWLDLDPKEPGVQKAIKSGVFLDCGTDKQGRRIVLISIGKMNLKEGGYKKRDILRAIACNLSYLYMDEETQVNGSVNVFDMTGFSMLHQNMLTIEDRRNFFKMYEKNFPARIKAFHMYNAGAFIEFMLMIMKLIMSEKLQKRIHQHGSNMEGLYEKVGMEYLPEEYLPDDYTGPTVGSTADITERYVNDMCSGDTYERIKLWSSSKWKVDESKRPAANVPQASFRKLNVD